MQGFLYHCFTCRILFLALFVSGSLQAQEDPISPVAALRALTREQADQHRSMRLRGVVTYYEPQKFLAFIQDSTGGTYVHAVWNVSAQDGLATDIHPGVIVDVTGKTTGGKFAPALGIPDPGNALNVRVVGEGKLPLPLRPVRGELLDSKLHSQWIELDAFVRTIEASKQRLELSLVYGGHRFKAYIPGTFVAEQFQHLVGSDIRISGVYGSIFNDRRQLIGVQLFTPSPDHIEIIDPHLDRAFSLPIRPVQEILQFNPTTAERIHIQGTVIFHETGRGFFLRDATAAVWVDDPTSPNIKLGTWIDAVGFAAIEYRSPTLRDSVVRMGEVGPFPEPVMIDAQVGLTPGLHGQLVKLEAVVLDRLILPNSHMLALKSGDTVFNARFATSEGMLQLPELGSGVSITGICQNIFRGNTARDASALDSSTPDSFTVLMRDRNDLVLLRKPAWWTNERLLKLAGALVLSVASVLAWVAILRRQVLQQSALIAEKLSAERVSEERTRIARELHDTLEQHLAGVAIQLEAAAARLPAEPAAAADSLTLGAAMLRHSRSEARRSVWDLRSQQLETAGLCATIHELAEFMSTAECQVTFQIHGRERRLDSQVEFHLLRIVQEALANAVKHAAASMVTVTLEFENQGVTLSVSDNGRGFTPAAVSSGLGAHFGLLGMQERASKLRGKLEIKSALGVGSQIHIKLPVLL